MFRKFQTSFYALTKIFFIFLFHSNLGYSQTEVNLHAIYQFNNYELNQENTVDFKANRNEALSIFIDNKKSDSLFISDDNTINFSKEGRDSLGKQFYINMPNKKLTFRDFVYIDNEFMPVIVEEALPNLRWDFTNKLKRIGNFNCNSARLSFRGRVYDAWYTSEIPTSLGPWKFHGLPGLIIEIKSQDNGISFRLTSIKSSRNENIKIPKNGKNIPIEKYIALKNDAAKDFVNNLKAKLPRGAVVNFKSEDHNIEKIFE
ncbi:GLPGLI family protein [Spirosoma pulveris]